MKTDVMCPTCISKHIHDTMQHEFLVCLSLPSPLTKIQCCEVEDIRHTVWFGTHVQL
jgi:hypothetical protein